MLELGFALVENNTRSVGAGSLKFHFEVLCRWLDIYLYVQREEKQAGLKGSSCIERSPLGRR